MKKLFAILLIAVLVLALVACGGDPETTTTTEAAGSSTTPDTTTTPDSDPVDPAPGPGGEGEGGDVEGGDDDEDDVPPHFEEGIDIMNGDSDFMAIDPFWNSSYPCAFENHHSALNFNWALVIKMQESTESVYEQLIGMNPDMEEGTSNFVVFNQYDWIVEIDGVDHKIENFSVYNFGTSGYVRLDLGEDFTFAEGEHEYDISLKIVDAETGKLEFWAWFADPLCGKYPFTEPAPIEMVPDPTVGEDVAVLPTGALVGVSGPAGFSSESYTNLFDGEVRKKLCSDDPATSIIFAISDDVLTYTIKSISIVGANDDESYTDRIVTSFKVYGADSGEENAAWDLLVTADGTKEVTPVNYGEVNYAFTKDSTYRYYKIVLDRPEGTYQFSEVLLYAEKGSVTTAG